MDSSNGMRLVLTFELLVLLTVTFSKYSNAQYNNYYYPRCDLQYPCKDCGYKWTLDEKDCTKFYLCLKGVSYGMACPKGTMFSKSINTCIYYDEERCYNSINSAPRATTKKPTQPPRLTNWWEATRRTTRRVPPTITARPTTTTRRTTKATTTRRTTTASPPRQQSCGVKLVPSIIGGRPASSGEWPWMVSLQSYGYHFCGASLLNNDWILTAAHCVYGKSRSSFNAVFGAYRLGYYGNNVQKRNIDRIIISSYYSYGGSFPYDVAIVKLSQPVVYSSSVQPICLPDSSDVFTDQDQCWITGWGETKGTGDSNVLNELYITPTRYDFCKQYWGNNVQNYHICIGDGRTGSCMGDSGGPLNCIRNGRYFLAGMTSWGHTSCKAYGYTPVYSKIAYYVDWIKDTIFANS